MNGNEPTIRPMVLIVDRHDDLRDLYGDWFVSVGFEVVCAADAPVAFQIAKAYRPDLVVTELCLRRSDGLQLIRQLRATAVTQDLPILVVTTSTCAGVLDQAIAAGATAAMPALGSVDALGANVTAIMARASATRRGSNRRHMSLSAILNGSLTADGTEL